MANLQLHTFELFVTSIEAEDALLKIWGQTDQNSMVLIERLLLQYSPQFNSGQYVPNISNLKIGQLCFGKYGDGVYYRSRIIDLSRVPEGLAVLHFIDHGNTEPIPLTSIRVIDNVQSTPLGTVNALAHQFILAGVVHASHSWDMQSVDMVTQLICNLETAAMVVGSAGPYQLIRVHFNNQDLSDHLIKLSMAVPVAISAQELMIGNRYQIPQAYPKPIVNNMNNYPPVVANQAFSPQRPPRMGFRQPLLSPRSSVSETVANNFYKTTVLPVGSEHDVTVSAVEEGPKIFSVQIQGLEKQLHKVMSELNALPQIRFRGPASHGALCMARCTTHKFLCRAVITDNLVEKCKVFFVDFGHTDEVPFSDIFELPSKFLSPFVLAFRFRLTNLQNINLTPQFKKAFRDFVTGKHLKLKVRSPDGPPMLQYGELFDEQGVNVLDIVKEMVTPRVIKYKKMKPIDTDCVIDVIVCYVYSVNEFYVHIFFSSDALNKLMTDLNVYCKSAETFTAGEVKPGLACCAFFFEDQKWYRAQVLSKEGTEYKIKYIDYGNEETVSLTRLKKISPELANRLEIQSVKCCLNGHETTPFDMDLATKFENASLGNKFTMKIIRYHNDLLVVDLHDVNYVKLKLDDDVEEIAPEVTTPWNKDYANFNSEQVNEQFVQNHIQSNTEKKGTGWRGNDKPPRFQHKSNLNNTPSTVSDRLHRNKKVAPYSKGHNKRHDGGGDNWNNNASGTRTNDNLSRNRQQRSDFASGDSGANRNSNNNKVNYRRNDLGAGANKRSPSIKDETWEDKPTESWRDKSADSSRDRPTDSWRDKQTDSWRNKKTDTRNDGKGGQRSWDKPQNRQDSTGRQNKRSGSNTPSDAESWSSKRSDNESKPKARSFPSPKKDNSNWKSNKKNSPGDGYNSDQSRGSNASSAQGHRKPQSDKRRQFPPKDGPPPDYASLEDKYLDMQIVEGSQETVCVSWFYNPKHFYLQTLSSETKFSKLMKDIQTSYRHREPISGYMPVGSSVIAHFAEDGVLYRASVIDVRAPKYKVRYVDFGNTATVHQSKMWRIEKRFMEMPVQCVVCSLPGVFPPDGTKWVDSDSMDNCFNKGKYTCVFGELEDGKRVVSLTDTDGRNIVDELIDKQLIITENQTQQCHVDTASSHQVPGIQQDLEEAPVDIGLLFEQTIRVTVSFVYGLERFFVYLDKNKARSVLDAVKTFMESVDTADMEPVNPENLTIGTVCLTKADNGSWLRSIVTDCASTNGVFVEFPDIGGGEEVSASKMVTLPWDLTHYYYQALECKLYSLSENSTLSLTDEQFKTKYENEELIAYVNLVTNGKLEVTLYDLNGNKLDLIQPDDDAFPTIVPICPMPIVNSHVNVWISYINSLNSIYVQRSVDSEKVTRLLDSLFDFYETNKSGELTEVVPENVYAVKSAVDGNWYRGLVTEVTQDGIMVIYIDYGNAEKVTTEDIRQLDSRFYDIHELALHIALPATVINENGLLDKLADLTADKEFSTNLAYVDGIWYAELYDSDNVPLTKALIDGGFVTNLDFNPFDRDSAVVESVPDAKIAIYVSHADSPSQFYAQLLDDDIAINQLQDELQASIEELTVLESPDTGVLCAAKYSADDVWYRAEVLDADDQITTVRFVDYGNTDVLDNASGCIKTLPTKMLTVDKYAKKCSLDVAPITGEEWNQQACEIFETKVMNESVTVTAEILHQDERGTTFLNLFADNENIGEHLIEQGYAKRIVRDAEEEISGKTGFISHINSINEFWIQLESTVPDLEAMADNLAIADTLPDLDDKRPGVLCAAKYPDDESWYRARILTVENDEINVLFIDYGNSSNATELKVLPEEVVNVRSLAMKCTLQKPAELTQWPADADDKFNELSKDGATIFNVKVISTGETSTIELTVDGIDAVDYILSKSDRLPPIGETSLPMAAVSHVESLQSFWLQYEVDLMDLETINDKLMTAFDFEIPDEVDKDELYAALFSDDGLWYRAKINSELNGNYEVSFIDFGNSCLTEQIRILSPDLKNVRPLAIKSQLELPKGVTEWNDEGKSKFVEISAAGETFFEVELVDQNSDPVTVKLLLDGDNVLSQIMINRDRNGSSNDVINTTDSNANAADIIEECINKAVPEQGFTEVEDVLKTCIDNAVPEDEVEEHKEEEHELNEREEELKGIEEELNKEEMNNEVETNEEISNSNEEVTSAIEACLIKATETIEREKEGLEEEEKEETTSEIETDVMGTERSKEISNSNEEVTSAFEACSIKAAETIEKEKERLKEEEKEAKKEETTCELETDVIGTERSKEITNSNEEVTSAFEACSIKATETIEKEKEEETSSEVETDVNRTKTNEVVSNSNEQVASVIEDCLIKATEETVSDDEIASSAVDSKIDSKPAERNCSDESDVKSTHNENGLVEELIDRVERTAEKNTYEKNVSNMLNDIVDSIDDKDDQKRTFQNKEETALEEKRDSEKTIEKNDPASKEILQPEDEQL